MELTTINKLYLELSQITTAKTKREIELEQALHRAVSGHPCEKPLTWIKCVDELPSHLKEGSISGIDVICHVTGFKRARLLTFFTGLPGDWYDEDGRLFKGEVLAWLRMPLPPHVGNEPDDWKY